MSITVFCFSIRDEARFFRPHPASLPAPAGTPRPAAACAWAAPSRARPPGALWPPDGACSAARQCCFRHRRGRSGPAHERRGPSTARPGLVRVTTIRRLKQLTSRRPRCPCPPGDGVGTSALAAHLMRIVAHQQHFHPARPCRAQGDLHHRAGVRVYQQTCAAHWGVTCKSTGL